MNEDAGNMLNNILTILIGVAIVAFIYLILYRKRRSKLKRMERDSDLLKSNKEMRKGKKILIKKNSHSR